MNDCEKHLVAECMCEDCQISRIPTVVDSVSILREAANTIEERAAERDISKEKSMRDTVNAFNAMYHTDITEEQGWMFMVLLKMRRSRGGKFRKDDYVDGAAYFALAAESVKS